MDGFERLPAYGNQPLLVSLSDAPEAPCFCLQVRYAQSAQFRYAQPARIHQLNHGPVAHAHNRLGVRLLQQPIHLLEAQEFGQALAESRRFDRGRRIFLDVTFHEREPEEVPYGDQVAGDRAAVEALTVERAEEIHHVASSHVPCAEFARGSERRKFRDVAPVRLDRIVRQAFFDPQAIQECANLRFQVLALSFISGVSKGASDGRAGTVKRRITRRSRKCLQIWLIAVTAAKMEADSRTCRWLSIDEAPELTL